MIAKMLCIFLAVAALSIAVYGAYLFIRAKRLLEDVDKDLKR